MLNTRIENIVLGSNNVTRMMLGEEIAWPVSPTLLFTVAASQSVPIRMTVYAPTEFLIFDIEGGNAVLYREDVGFVANSTLSTIAHGTSGFYTKIHRTPNSKIIPVSASFDATLGLQIRAYGTQKSGSTRYTTGYDRQNGHISIQAINEYNIDVTFQVEVKNPSGIPIYSGAFTAVKNKMTFSTFAQSLGEGTYKVTITNMLTNANYIKNVRVVTYRYRMSGPLRYNFEIDLNAESPGLLQKTISIYPASQEAVYKSFYNDAAVIEILVYNIDGPDYTAIDRSNFALGLGGAYAYARESAGAMIVLAKLRSGGSGYRANAFYPIYYNNPDTYAGEWYTEPGFGVGANDINVSMIPVLVALTDSSGVVTQIVEYDEQKYGYRLYNDRTSGAGMHFLHFSATYYEFSYTYTYSTSYGGAGGGGGNFLWSHAPQYVTYLDPVTGAHLIDSNWVAENVNSESPGEFDRMYFINNEGTMDDPFSSTGGADVVAILANIPSGFRNRLPVNPVTEANIVDGEYTAAPHYFHTLDPEENWYDDSYISGSTYGMTLDTGELDRVDWTTSRSTRALPYDTNDFVPGPLGTESALIRASGYGSNTTFTTVTGIPPWQESLGGTGVGSPVYKDYYPGLPRLAFDTFALENNSNLSKKSIEFINVTGHGPPVAAPDSFTVNNLLDAPGIKSTHNIDFGEATLVGLSGTGQNMLKAVRGKNLSVSLDPKASAPDTFDVTPDALEGIYGKDTVFTDIKEYCELEIGAIIPSQCMDELGSLLKTHPGDPLNTTCLSVAELTNFSLYTFYVRLKAKGSGYPPNSKIPVYIRRGGAHIPGYDSSKLPSNPGPTLEIGHVSSIAVDGRGSGGPCICMIHTDNDGITTHITEYVDPKSKCRSERGSDIWPGESGITYNGGNTEDFTADHIDGVYYDGAESPLLTLPGSPGNWPVGFQWYRERPSQYRRLMNFGEVSDSVHGYAKDYIAPIDLVDDSDTGKAKWTGSDTDKVLKAYNFGSIARWKGADNFEQKSQSIFYRNNGWRQIMSGPSSSYPAIQDNMYYYSNSTSNYNTATIFFDSPTEWHKIISKNDMHQVDTKDLVEINNFADDSRQLGWQSFQTWQTYRDVYIAKGIAYNRPTDLSPTNPGRFTATGQINYNFLERQYLEDGYIMPDFYTDNSDVFQENDYSGIIRELVKVPGDGKPGGAHYSGATLHGLPIYKEYNDGLGSVAFYNTAHGGANGRDSQNGYYYYSPGVDQSLADRFILFDRHGFTNEGFAPSAKVPYKTQNYGPDYIICRIATPNGPYTRTVRTQNQNGGAIPGGGYQSVVGYPRNFNYGYISEADAEAAYGPYILAGQSGGGNGIVTYWDQRITYANPEGQWTNSNQIKWYEYYSGNPAYNYVLDFPSDVKDSLNMAQPGLQGQSLNAINFHCWWITNHDHWVSLGDVTPENGGRKIIVQDAFGSNRKYNILPGVYKS